jgi:hypothetical protein
LETSAKKKNRAGKGILCESRRVFDFLVAV